MSSKLGKVIANFNSQLSTKVAVGGTTASINSKIDADGVTIPNGRYFVTFDSDNSRKEHFSCVLTTTSSGADLTALKTVNRTTGVETSGALREHKIGAKVTITDYATIAKLVDILNGVETLDGSSPLSYDAQPTLSSGTQLATVQYVLDHVAGGTVSFDQQVLTAQTSGEALTANDIGYFKESDQKWYKADADLTATFDQLQLGIVKSTVAINSGVSIAISGPVGGFTGLTAGSKYYLSNTAGAITTTPGTYSVFIGWALNTTTIMFNPLNKTAPTQKEKDALAGSQGVPSSTNKYRTQDNSSAASTDQTQTTQNGTVELGEADSTTKKNKIAQSFIPTKTKIRGVNLYKSADTGTFTGTVTISIQADSASAPSGSALATKTFTNIEWGSKSVGAFETIFTSEYASLTVGSTYWIVIETSTSDNSNHPNIGTNTAGGYGSGSVKYKNTTDGWVAVSTVDLYFSTMEGTASQGVSTDDTGKIPAAFFDTAKMPLPAFEQSLITNFLQDIQYSTTNQTGSNLYVLRSGSLKKYERDTLTGAYIEKYSVSVSGSSRGGMTVLGDYVYTVFDNGTNLASYRYLATDLTGETAMAVPTVIASGTDQIFTWNDGKYLYTTTSTDNDINYKWSVSGTTFSSVSTATSSIASNPTLFASSFFDGTSAYIATATTTSVITVYKYTNIDGSSNTSTTYNIIGGAYDGVPGTRNGIMIGNIDSNRMYIGNSSENYESTNFSSVSLVIKPITKP